MKNRLAVPSFHAILRSALALALLLAASSALAEGGQEGGKDDHEFAEHKGEMVKRANDEKAMVDQFASCVSSAQNHDAMKKCHEARHGAQEKLQDKDRDMKRAHLQKELKELDEQHKAK